MTANGTRPSGVARDLGVAPSTVDNWLHGRLPATHRLDELADILHAPELIKIVLNSTARRCARCRRKFYANPRIAYKAKYCSSACKRAVGRARKSKAEIGKRRESVVTMQRAIAAYCRGCEPEGICREAACELRKFSPFPLVTRRKAA